MKLRLGGRAPATYEESTYESAYWLIRFPHQRRFGAAVEEILRARPRTLLDYGTGDAHLLAVLNERGPFPSCVGYEPVLEYAEETRRRVGRYGLEDQVTVVTDLSECEGMTFDVISCLGVLEHMPLPQRNLFYDFCETHLTAGGVGLIDVPVEIGLSVLIKEFGRRVLKRYPTAYSTGALLRRASGLRDPDPARFDPHNESTWILPHTGFDHRYVVEEVRARFRLTRVFGTPLQGISPVLGNQEAFIVFERDPARPLPQAVAITG